MENLFTTFNLLILNYTLGWFFFSIGFKEGLTILGIIWLITITLKMLYLFAKQKIILFIIVFISILIPFLAPILIIIPAILLLSNFLGVIKNWYLILFGCIIYYLLFYKSSDIHNWYVLNLANSYTYVASFATGFCIVLFSCKFLKFCGIEKKRIETVFLGLPLFIVSLFFILANSGNHSSEDYS